MNDMSWPPPLEYHEHRWDRVNAEVRDSRGPERVYARDPDPDFKPRAFLGFTNRRPEQEPELWEGDQA